MRLLVSCAAQKAEWQSHLDLGQKYLLDGNYEQAIVEFNRVIEIDPKNVEAYIGLADAYAALGDYESAIEALERGIAETDSDELRAKLEEIRALAEAAASAGEEGQGETETGTGGDEDRGEPETTGQDEQTEQEEGMPEVPEFIRKRQTKSIGTGQSIEVFAEGNDDSHGVTANFTIQGEWISTIIGEYNADTMITNNIHYSPEPIQTSYYQQETNVNVTKTENSFNTKDLTTIEYDSEKDIWICSVENDSLISGISTKLINTEEFNTSGDLLALKTYSDSGELVCSYENEYDENGNQVKQTFFNGLNEIPISGVCQYSYDYHGRIIEAVSDWSYESRDLHRNYDTYFEYDSSGNMVRAEAYISDNINNMTQKATYIYEYNSDNLPVKQSFYISYDNGNGFSQSNFVRTVNYVY